MADPVLEVLGVGVALPVDVEPGVPDDVQVVADAPTELGGLLVFELEVEFPADPAQRREQPSRRHRLHSVLVLEPHLVAFDEPHYVVCPVVLAVAGLLVQLHRVSVGMEERCQRRCDGVRLPRHLLAGVVDGMDLLDEQRAQILESGGHLVFLGPGQHHQVHQAQIIVAPAFAMGRHGSVQQAHDLFLGSVPDHCQHMAGSLHDGRNDQIPVLLDGGDDLRLQKAVAGLVGEVEVDDEGP